MEPQTAGQRAWLPVLWLVVVLVVLACERRVGSVDYQEQDDEAVTADPFPNKNARDATPDEMRTACQNLSLEPSPGVVTTWPSNSSSVAIRPAKGNHKITPADLADGRMVSRIEVKTGAGIPEYGIGSGDSACLLIVGRSPGDSSESVYDSLETIFVSVNKGPVANYLTTVIHKAKVHPHADADWIRLTGPPLPSSSGQSGARGMIPWLLQPPFSFVVAAQSGCGKYSCCVQVQPK